MEEFAIAVSNDPSGYGRYERAERIDKKGCQQTLLSLAFDEVKAHPDLYAVLSCRSWMIVS